MWFINRILRRIVCFRPNNTTISARSQYSFFISFWFSGLLKKTYTFLTQSRKSAKISARSLCSLITINGFFSSFWNVSGRYKSSWIRPYITSVTNKRTHCTDKLCDSPTKYWEESHVLDTHKNKMACSQSCIAFSQVSGFLVGIKKHKICFWRKSAKISARSLCSLTTINGFLEFLGGINRHEQDHITSVTNIRTHCTDKLCDSPTQYWEESHVSDTHKKMACSQIAIIYSFFSSFWSVCKTFFRRKSTNILARSLRSLDIIFLKFLVSNEQDHIMSVTNTVMDILYRQTVINQQCIYWDLRRIVWFSTQILKKSARSLRSLAILYTFSPVSNASSFNKAIYHEHIEWTNTRTYCTDKNMLLTNLTIAHFQRKIRKFWLARCISYICFQVRIVKKKEERLTKPYFQLLRKFWWLPHPDPHRALYAKCNWEITVSITPDDHLECPYLQSWKLESFRGLCPLGPRQELCPCTPPGPVRRPLDPTRMRRNRMFQTHTHTQLDCSQ